MSEPDIAAATNEGVPADIIMITSGASIRGCSYWGLGVGRMLGARLLDHELGDMLDSGLLEDRIDIEMFRCIRPFQAPMWNGAGSFFQR